MGLVQPKFTGLTARLEKISDLLKQLGELHAQHNTEKIKKMQALIVKAKEIQAREAKRRY